MWYKYPPVHLLCEKAWAVHPYAPKFGTKRNVCKGWHSEQCNVNVFLIHTLKNFCSWQSLRIRVDIP